ncbi:MAG: Fic family protein [Elusimicrobiota bacterium]
MPDKVLNFWVLNQEDVIKIHEALIEHFNEIGEPIFPPGVKDYNLLSSAVSRQTVGDSSQLKYSNPRHNAVSLMYGLCMNHPFHNGNKRTALVSYLAHLNTNGFIFDKGIQHKDLYRKILDLASHKICPNNTKKITSDNEINELYKWTTRITRKATNDNHPITFRKLNKILSHYGFYFENYDKGFVSIYKDEEIKENGFLGLIKKEVKRKSRIAQIVYRGDGRIVEPNTIKMIRQKCGLIEKYGVDSHAFYNLETATDWLISGYSNILKKLSNK